MKYLLTKEESEKLYPGLKDMPKGEIPEDAIKDFVQLKGEGSSNWKDGVSYDIKAYYKEYYQENKEKYTEREQTPEYKSKAREWRERPEIKTKKSEYDKEYRDKPENKAKQKEYQKAYYIKKKLAISTTCL
jgi:hypothetical protein